MSINDCVLQTEALTKVYGHSPALNGLTMRVPRGSVYGFVGKNGAGKTTLFRLICGLQRPSSGGFSLFGIPHDSARIVDARRHIGALVESPAIYRDLTAEENLRQQYRILGLDGFDGIDALLRLAGLQAAGGKKARHLSLGMRQRLGVAMTLVGNPDFLMLDEPGNGLDPQGVAELRQWLIRLNGERGVTLLISSHNLHELSRLATHYGVIDGGRMVREFSAGEAGGDLEDYYLSLVGGVGHA